MFKKEFGLGQYTLQQLEIGLGGKGNQKRLCHAGSLSYLRDHLRRMLKYACYPLKMKHSPSCVDL